MLLPPRPCLLLASSPRCLFSFRSLSFCKNKQVPMCILSSLLACGEGALLDVLLCPGCCFTWQGRLAPLRPPGRFTQASLLPAAHASPGCARRPPTSRHLIVSKQHCSAGGCIYESFRGCGVTLLDTARPVHHPLKGQAVLHFPPAVPRARGRLSLGRNEILSPFSSTPPDIQGGNVYKPNIGSPTVSPKWRQT